MKRQPDVAIRLLLGMAIAVASAGAHAVSAYAGAFNGPSGVLGAEESGTTFASASNKFDNGDRGMYALGTAGAGELHALATAYNNQGGSYQYATTVVSFEDRFTLSHPDGVTRAELTWELHANGSCAASDGSTGGYRNATCYAQISLNSGMLALDGPGMVTKTSTVDILNAFGNVNTFSIESFMQVGGYATYGSFSADFRNTARIYVYSTTDGVSLITDSGHNYSPVPEPSTASLLLGSLALAGLWLKRKQPAP